MFDFLKSQAVYYVYYVDGTIGQVNAKSEDEAVRTAQSMQGKAVSKVQFSRYVSDPVSDFERLNRR